MEYYFNNLPFEMLQVIDLYLELDDFLNLSLLFNDYHSRRYLELLGTPTYNLYKSKRKDKGIRLNKLLTFETFIYGKCGKFKTFRSLVNNIYMLFSKDLMIQIVHMYHCSFYIHIRTAAILYPDVTKIWTNMILENLFKGICDKVYLLEPLIKNPEVNLLISCIDLHDIYIYYTNCYRNNWKNTNQRDLFCAMKNYYNKGTISYDGVDDDIFDVFTIYENLYIPLSLLYLQDFKKVYPDIKIKVSCIYKRLLSTKFFKTTGSKKDDIQLIKNFII